MTNIIDYTYFKSKLDIANAVETGYVQIAVANLITEEQYNLLNKMLGPVLYAQFKTWYETLPLDTGNTFNDLLNGKVFTSVAGYQVNWVGLMNAQKISPIANYCYCEWQERNVTQSVSMGEVKTQSQNSITADPVAKSVAAWNLFVNMMFDYIEFMNKYYATNANWTGYLGYANSTHCDTRTFYGQRLLKFRNSLGL